MTTEKYLRQRVLKQNIEITQLTSQIDSLTSTLVDIKETLKETEDNHLSFVSELQEQVKTLTNNLKDLQMDMCRSELDRRLYD